MPLRACGARARRCRRGRCGTSGRRCPFAGSRGWSPSRTATRAATRVRRGARRHCCAAVGATPRRVVGGVGDNDGMLLADLVEARKAVRATRSRKAKTAALASALAAAEPDEVETVTSYLSGTLRQRRTGLGWRSLSALPAPADEQQPHGRRGARHVRGAEPGRGRRVAGASHRARRRTVRPRDGRRAGLPARPRHRRAPAGRARRHGPRGGRDRRGRAGRCGAPRLDVRRLHTARRRRCADRRRRGARDVHAAARPADPADAGLQRRRGRRGDGQGGPGRRDGRRGQQARRHPHPGPQVRRTGARLHPQPRGDHRPRARGRRGRRATAGPHPRARRRGHRAHRGRAGPARSRRPGPAPRAGSTSPRCGHRCPSRRTSSTCCTSTARTSSTPRATSASSGCRRRCRRSSWCRAR